MKSNFNSIDYHERIRDLDLREMRKREIFGFLEVRISEDARKFCQNEGYYYEENPLLLEIKNEIDKINTADRNQVLEYVLGESYKQRDETLYITSRFENKYFFAGYDENHNRINEDKHKIILILAIYCYRNASIPIIKPIKIERRSKSFWENLKINRYNAEEEFIVKTSQLTEMDVFFICLSACQQAYCQMC